MNDPDQTVAFPLPKDTGPAADPWPLRTVAQPQTRGQMKGCGMSNPAAEKKTLRPTIGHLHQPGFIEAALKRSAWLWCATAVLGIIVGYGLYAKFLRPIRPPPRSLLPATLTRTRSHAAATNVTLAQSQAVAGEAVQS